jgi:hypothetical protein
VYSLLRDAPDPEALLALRVHHEDRFVVADSARAARRFHEDAEGYDRDEAHRERIAPGGDHASSPILAEPAMG